MLIAAWPALAGEGLTAWQRAQHSDARLLVPTEVSRDGWTYAGIELRLPPGAKTYWRTPGDTGVAPTFDFSGSAGVSAPSVLFPAPEAFEDGVGGVAYGYHGSVILPVRFRASGPAKLAIQMGYGVCLKALCVPATVSLSADVPSRETRASASQVPVALQAVPVTAKVGAAEALAITDIKAAREGLILTLTVKARAPAPPQLFAEAEDGFTPPKAETTGDGYLFTTRVEKGAADRPWGKARLTLVLNRMGIETEIDLDALAAQ